MLKLNTDMYKILLNNEFGEGIFILLGGLDNNVAAKLIEVDVRAEKAGVPCFLYNVETSKLSMEEVFNNFKGKEIIMFDDLFERFDEKILDKMVSTGAKTIIVALRDFHKFIHHKVEYRYVVIEDIDNIKTYKIAV